ncbi:hypothetical protein [uncultured Stenotrophomonas sp.]|uniref:hypothetical protein n=1 Tax=uncultured Stenotrophomonas sp. TaxID=165438 RepID=UPI0025EC06BF|nr:hypothetical protein [uncultured Stenotrophomonas sp.]
MSNDHFFEIVDYRDFHDVPRLIAVRSEDERVWIFDSKFNGDLDEYEFFYRVYLVDLDTALGVGHIEEYLKGRCSAQRAEVRVSQIDFDATRRRPFMVNDWQAPE